MPLLGARRTSDVALCCHRYLHALRGQNSAANANEFSLHRFSPLFTLAPHFFNRGPRLFLQTPPCLGSCSDDEIAAAMQNYPELAERFRTGTALPKAKAPPPQLQAEMAAAQPPVAQHSTGMILPPALQIPHAMQFGVLPTSGNLPYTAITARLARLSCTASADAPIIAIGSPENLRNALTCAPHAVTLSGIRIMMTAAAI